MKERGRIFLEALKVRYSNWINASLSSPIERERTYAAVASNFYQNYSHFRIGSQNGVIAVNKPPGLLSHGVRNQAHEFGLNDLVQLATNNSYTNIAHRLDMDTSGVILLGEDRNTLASLNRQFAAREVHKRYLAIVDGYYPEVLAGVIAPIGESGRRDRPMQVDIDGKTAATSFRPILRMKDPKTNKEYTLVEVGLHHSGRTHQIRVHSSHMEFPIVGDSQYHDDPSGALRQMLHAYEIDIREPKTQPEEGRRITFRAPIPEDFMEFISRMESVAVNGRYEEVINS
jgi:RluA family pseudouridine synthase